jgi:hypothetical protein
MGLAELADGGHVDGVVQLAVPAFGGPVHDAATGGELDRGGAVVGGVAVPVGEPGDVCAVADEHGGDDGATPIRSVTVVLEARTASRIRVCDALSWGVEAADVVEEFDCEVVAGLFDRAGWGEDLE